MTPARTWLKTPTKKETRMIGQDEYEIVMFVGGGGAQQIEMTRREYIALKRYLAALREAEISRNRKPKVSRAMTATAAV